VNEELLAAHELILDAITPGPWAIEPGGAAPACDPDTTCIRVVAGEPNAISGIRSKVVSTDVARLQSDGAVQNELNATFIAGAPAAMRALIDEPARHRPSTFAQREFQWCRCEALVG